MIKDKPQVWESHNLEIDTNTELILIWMPFNRVERSIYNAQNYSSVILEKGNVHVIVGVMQK